MPEAAGLRVDRAVERTDGHLVIVTRVDHDRIGIGDQRIPVLRLDISAGAFPGIDAALAHRDDLGLEPHLHPLEGQGGRVRQFHVEIGAAGQRADMVQHPGNRLV